jgi:ribosomal protein L6P/L9E
MKKTLIAALFIAVLTACGADDPESQLSKIDELLADNHPLTTEQTSQITDAVANGKRLLAEGKNKEASTQFAAAIDVLEKAADADRFNKSE